MDGGGVKKVVKVLSGSSPTPPPPTYCFTKSIGAYDSVCSGICWAVVWWRVLPYFSLFSLRSIWCHDHLHFMSGMFEAVKLLWLNDYNLRWSNWLLTFHLTFSLLWKLSFDVWRLYSQSVRSDSHLSLLPFGCSICVKWMSMSCSITSTFSSHNQLCFSSLYLTKNLWLYVPFTELHLVTNTKTSLPFSHQTGQVEV